MSDRRPDLDFVSSPTPSVSSEEGEPELVPSTPVRGGQHVDGARILYVGGARSSPAMHDMVSAGAGIGVGGIATPETPARPRAPPPPQAADELPGVANVGVGAFAADAGNVGGAGGLFLDWAAASPLDDTQALDASSSGEEGRRRDLEESMGAVEDDETSPECTNSATSVWSIGVSDRLEDPLSRSATLSPENDPCRLGCCALLSQRKCEAHLLLLSSCRPTMDVPHIVHLGKERCTIGRAIESDVYLDSVAYPRTLSREHAVIERIGPCDYIVKDLRSVNGVSVNGKSVKEVQALAPGDVILFGRKTPQPEFEYLFEVEDFRAYRRPRSDGEDRRGLKRSREDGGGECENKVLRLDGMAPLQADNG